MAKKITSALGRSSNSTSTGGDESYMQDNIAEYTVAKKVEGKYLLHKILYFVGVFAFLILICAVLGIFLHAFGVLAGIALSATFFAILWYFLHRYLEIEYSYAIENSELICTEIYGNKSDKLLLQIRMSAIEKTVPYEGDYKKEADAFPSKDRTVLVSSWSSDQIYYSIYQREDGTKGIVFFEASNKTLKAFRYFNKDATVVKEMKR